MKKQKHRWRRPTWGGLKDAVLISVVITLILAGLLGYLIWRTDKSQWLRIPCSDGVSCFLYKPGIPPAKEFDNEKNDEKNKESD